MPKQHELNPVGSVEVKALAQLAGIHLEEEEVLQISSDLQETLGHFHRISQISTVNVQPAIRASVRILEDSENSSKRPDQENLELRPEEILEETQEDLLKNAPELSGNLFTVPPVV